jgi:hypothetical protein
MNYKYYKESDVVAWMIIFEIFRILAKKKSNSKIIEIVKYN